MGNLENIRKVLKEVGFVDLGDAEKDVCIQCNKPFTYDNVHTDAGWMETQISGLCEDCFDATMGIPE